jgi:hypothetical protein
MFTPLGALIFRAGLPAAALYHLLIGSIFFNTAAIDATGLERIGNVCLIPSHYLFVGREAIPTGEGGYYFEQRFTYVERVWPKVALSSIALPFTTAAGLTLKTAALFTSRSARRRQRSMRRSDRNGAITSNRDYYTSIGIDLSRNDSIPPPKHRRHASHNGYMEQGREALREIARLFDEHDIPFWLDCGSALGAHRYGGVIPWDNDIDIAILETDHDNALAALRRLDPDKYLVQDWSNRDYPRSYLKVYSRDENMLIDIYHFRIDAEEQTLTYIISNYTSPFLSKIWRLREEATVFAEPFSAIFPLKRAVFDGIDVYVPNQLVPYLKRRYGENIEPVKLYNEVTRRYEKDLSHPYWELEYAH